MTGSQIQEVVGRFEAHEPFKAAVEGLLEAGFARSDLSVLDTHESLTASEGSSAAWQESLIGLIGEIKYIGPITAAGLIAVATGPMGAAIAAGVAAGLTGVALQELLESIKATPHTESFARALESGAVLLWVRIEDAKGRALAEEILTRHGAHDLHHRAR